MTNRSAQRIDSATFHSAGQHADSIQALVRIGTFSIVFTLWTITHDRCTSAGRIRNGIDRALAHDRSQRQRIEDRARLFRRTNARQFARIGAVFVEAGQMTGTVGVHTAFRFSRYRCRLALAALDIRITDEAVRTFALRLMTNAKAVGGFGAGVGIANRSTDAVESIAGLIVRAVFVVLAHAGDASNERIALGADATRAGGAMVLRHALGVVAALDGRIVGARVEAFAVVAGLVVGAIVVGGTFGCGIILERIS